MLRFLMFFLLAACAQRATKAPEPARDPEPQVVVETKKSLMIRDFVHLDVTTLPKDTSKDLTIAGWQLTHALFGYMETTPRGTFFVVSSEVPFKVGRLFGWALHFRQIKEGQGVRPLNLVERLELPEPPRVFRYDQKTTALDRKGKVATTKIKIDPIEKWVFNFWECTREDPLGEYRIDLQVHGEPTQNFKFVLVKGPADAESWQPSQ